MWKSDHLNHIMLLQSGLIWPSFQQWCNIAKKTKSMESPILILVPSRGCGQKQSVKIQSKWQALNTQCNAMNLINKVHCNEVNLRPGDDLLSRSLISICSLLGLPDEVFAAWQFNTIGCIKWSWQLEFHWICLHTCTCNMKWSRGLVTRLSPPVTDHTPY